MLMPQVKQSATCTGSDVRATLQKGEPVLLQGESEKSQPWQKGCSLPKWLETEIPKQDCKQDEGNMSHRNRYRMRAGEPRECLGQLGSITRFVLQVRQTCFFFFFRFLIFSLVPTITSSFFSPVQLGIVFQILLPLAFLFGVINTEIHMKYHKGRNWRGERSILVLLLSCIQMLI